MNLFFNYHVNKSVKAFLDTSCILLWYTLSLIRLIHQNTTL